MNDIFEDFDFGETQLNLDKILKEKHVNVSKMCKELGFDVKVITRYRNNDVRRVDVDTLTKICGYLNIGFNELITYIPPQNEEELDEEIL